MFPFWVTYYIQSRGKMVSNFTPALNSFRKRRTIVVVHATSWVQDIGLLFHVLDTENIKTIPHNPKDSDKYHFLLFYVTCVQYCLLHKDSNVLLRYTSLCLLVWDTHWISPSGIVRTEFHAIKSFRMLGKTTHKEVDIQLFLPHPV